MSDSDTYKRLLQLYNQLDAFMRQEFDVDRYADHSSLLAEGAKANRVIAHHLQELRAVAQLRNSLVHNPMPMLGDPIAVPQPQLVERYADIIRAIQQPVTAMSVAVPVQQLYTATLATELGEVIQTMDKNTYTHVPIIEDGQLIGIFSENTLLSYLAESGDAIITKDMKLSEFKSFLPLDAHHGEKFCFVSRKASLSEVYQLFNKAIKVRQRIGLVFITQSGLASQKPLGIITAWDLANASLDQDQ
jgi:CBS domain-containing protein